jgi:hypothetical protein
MEGYITDPREGLGPQKEVAKVDPNGPPIRCIYIDMLHITRQAYKQLDADTTFYYCATPGCKTRLMSENTVFTILFSPDPKLQELKVGLNLERCKTCMRLN